MMFRLNLRRCVYTLMAMLVAASLAGAGNVHARHLSGAADILPANQHHTSTNTQAPEGTVSPSDHALACCAAPLPERTTLAATIKNHPPLRLTPGESRLLLGRTIIPEPIPPRIVA